MIDAPRRAWLLPGGLYAVPLLAALVLGLAPAFDAAAWARLVADTQFAPALGLSLWVGIASSAATLFITLWAVASWHGTATWSRVQRALGPLLALPHTAFAIGLGLLLMPSGLPARLLAPLVGWQTPPDIATVQDRFGLALIASLVLKEVPFLLWTVTAQLQRAGQGAEIEHQIQVAGSMGYARRTAWWRVLWPQLLPRLALPLLAVWGYSLTVVDMALVLGPTRPPTLAMLSWQWLLDADVEINRQGAVAALLLAATMGLGAVIARTLMHASLPSLRHRWVRGDRPLVRRGAGLAGSAGGAAAALYAVVLLMLAFVSVAGVWSFPNLWPQRWTADAWAAVAGSGSTLALTAGLAVAAAATGLLLAVAWMETTTAHWDRRAAPLVFAPMLVPGVLLVLGLYRCTLWLGLDGSLAGLWLAHSLYTTPYVLVALAPAYRGHDPRLEHTARALGRSRSAYLWHVKWPMLAAPMAAAFAIGFAVSVAQYLSTQFVGGGRHVTVTTEALTLASGGQRSLAAAYALLQALLPALVFGAALLLARRQTRRFGGA